MRQRRGYEPRTVDRAVFATIGMLFFCYAVYILGPWYLYEFGSTHSTLYELFNSKVALKGYGTLLLIDSVALIYCAFRFPPHREILRNGLLAAFILRLYANIGVLLTLESWRPLTWLANVALLAIVTAYYLTVSVSERLTK